MAASRSTVERVVVLMLTHISFRKLGAILRELKEVPGNKSFRSTIELLDQTAREMSLREKKQRRHVKK